MYKCIGTVCVLTAAYCNDLVFYMLIPCSGKPPIGHIDQCRETDYFIFFIVAASPAMPAFLPSSFIDSSAKGGEAPERVPFCFKGFFALPALSWRLTLRSKQQISGPALGCDQTRPPTRWTFALSDVVPVKCTTEHKH